MKEPGKTHTAAVLVPRLVTWRLSQPHLLIAQRAAQPYPPPRSNQSPTQIKEARYEEAQSTA